MQFDIDLSWELGTDDFRFRSTQKTIGVRNSFWLQELPIEPNDILQIHPDIGISIGMTNYVIKKKNVRSFLQLIQTELNKPLTTQQQKQAAKRQIAKMHDVEFQKMLLRQLKANKLTLFDIMGDNAFFGGRITCSKNRIWSYTTES